MTYEYKKPRRLNLVTLVLLLAGVAGVYLGVKFIPVWWQGREVDEQLDGFAVQAVQFARYAEELRAKDGEKIVVDAIAALHRMGIEDQVDQPLQVWFSPDWSELHARYEVIVQHNLADLVKPTVLHMHRVRKVPQ
jgi:hypothetical protein